MLTSLYHSTPACYFNVTHRSCSLGDWNLMYLSQLCALPGASLGLFLNPEALTFRLSSLCICFIPVYLKERRKEAERIAREREELRRQQQQLRYEQEKRNSLKRPRDVDHR